jgi:chorismate mutase
MGGLSKIKKLRSLIDKTDKTIIKNLEKRFEIVKELGKVKKNLRLSIVDKKREKEVFENIKKYSQKYKKEIEEIYKKIIENSKKLQR